MKLLISMDENHYPTEDTLESIKKFDCFENGHDILMECIKPLFERYGRFEKVAESGLWIIATGGWSGCEDVIGALRANYTFWPVCWEMSRRGGYHEFRLPYRA